MQSKYWSLSGGRRVHNDGGDKSARGSGRNIDDLAFECNEFGRFGLIGANDQHPSAVRRVDAGRIDLCVRGHCRSEGSHEAHRRGKKSNASVDVSMKQHNQEPLIRMWK